MSAAPQLRFPEFDGELLDKRLGELLIITSASRVHKDEWTETGVPFFRSSDIVAAFKGADNRKAFISSELFEELSAKSGRPRKNDILVTGGGSIGIPFLVNSDDPLYFKDADLLWLKSSQNLCGSYLYSFFLCPVFRKYLKGISHIGTISHYTIEQAKATPINLPTLAEQEKIATFLGAVDNKVDALRRKHDALKQFKAGLMQKLFSQELRFKRDDGSDYPDWEEMRLGEAEAAGLLKLGRGKVISRHDMAAAPGTNPVYSSSATGSGEFGQYADWMFDEELITWSIDGGGRFFHRPKHKFSVTNVCGFLRINSPDLNYRFLSAALERQHLRQTYDYQSKAHPSVIRGLYDVPLAHADEQKKIADSLSAVDARIEGLADQIIHMESFKAGLLQKMFV